MLKKLFSNKKELILIILLLLISGISHGYNMFNFPYYENDEGTYMAQAWSVITQGKLAPYTYWYDHAPLGWFLISLWTILTGGFFTFGLSVNSGRVLMLVLHLIITLLIYLITKKITKSSIAGLLAGMIFSLTPLGIYYHRRVLLDNIMTFWTLISFYLLLINSKKLKYFILSALAFGIAILTKESAIFFLPALLYIVYSQAHKSNKSFAFFKWIIITATVISFYIIYATLKGELFPSGTPLGGDNPHVSLIETLTFQMGRSGEGNFLNPEGAFQWNLRNQWITKDAFIMIFGAVATIISLIAGIKNRLFRYISLMTASFWLYLMRGGIVIEFYIIPLLPFLAICISAVISLSSNLISKIKFTKLFKTAPYIFLLILLPIIYQDKTDIYLSDQTTNQIKAIKWIKNNIPSDSIIIIDNYAYVDLHSKIPGSVYIQKDAEYYWKADKDPDIKIEVLKNNWRNIDYILFSDQMKYDIYHAGLNLVRRAYENSDSIENYTGSGYDIEIRKVNSTQTPKS